MALFLAMLMLLVANMGCTSPQMTATGSIKTAWMMLQERQDTLGPPDPRRVEHVYDTLGHEVFLRDIASAIPSKYEQEAVYALGWFGDLRHVALVSTLLADEDPQTRRIALAAFSRLVGRCFTDNEEAIAWWSRNKDAFPACTRRGPVAHRTSLGKCPPSSARAAHQSWNGRGREAYTLTDLACRVPSETSEWRGESFYWPPA